MAGEEWHDKRGSTHWRECCDHMPLAPVEQKSNRIKRQKLFALDPATGKKPRGY
jgi:hypothetical protein